MALKKAHKLTPATLEPRSIEKTSVKLAVSVFCESTRDALQFYAANEGRQSWAATAEFLTLMIKVWNVLNVKTSTKGKHKRDITMDPVRSSLDWKLDFLKEFAAFLQLWESSSKPGLSKETFLALRHSCQALADCAAFLLDRRGFNYVLLGHLQSDAIETRFGWLRQLAGANYYISMRQVMEGDRKIRALSLLKFSHLSLAEIDQETSVPTEAKTLTSTQASNVADAITDALNYSQWPSQNDANIIYYVAGAIARSVVRTTKCNGCKELLTSSDVLDPLQLDDSQSVDYTAETFLNTINRGGLTRPAEYTYDVAVLCWRVFEEIRTSEALMASFLTVPGHRNLFARIMDRVPLTDQCFGDDFGDNYCVHGHDLKTLITERFFNCVAKNLAKDFTYKAADGGRMTKRCKIAKLQSTTN